MRICEKCQETPFPHITVVGFYVESPINFRRQQCNLCYPLTYCNGKHILCLKMCIALPFSGHIGVKQITNNIITKDHIWHRKSVIFVQNSTAFICSCFAARTRHGNKFGKTEKTVSLLSAEQSRAFTSQLPLYRSRPDVQAFVS